MILLLPPPQTASAAPCQVIVDGPAEGMCVGTNTEIGKGFSMMQPLPAPGPVPSMPEEQARVIRGALQAYDAAKPIPADVRAENAHARSCETWSEACSTLRPLTAWDVPAGLRHNAPYRLRDGRIRIEWMRDRKLALLSFVTFEGARISLIATAPAEFAMAPPRPAAP